MMTLANHSSISTTPMIVQGCEQVREKLFFLHPSTWICLHKLENHGLIFIYLMEAGGFALKNSKTFGKLHPAITVILSETGVSQE